MDDQCRLLIITRRIAPTFKPHVMFPQIIKGPNVGLSRMKINFPHYPSAWLPVLPDRSRRIENIPVKPSGGMGLGIEDSLKRPYREFTAINNVSLPASL
jgi:hypothetical protein